MPKLMGRQLPITNPAPPTLSRLGDLLFSEEMPKLMGRQLPISNPVPSPLSRLGDLFQKNVGKKMLSLLEEEHNQYKEVRNRLRELFPQEERQIQRERSIQKPLSQKGGRNIQQIRVDGGSGPGISYSDLERYLEDLQKHRIASSRGEAYRNPLLQNIVDPVTDFYKDYGNFLLGREGKLSKEVSDRKTRSAKSDAIHRGFIGESSERQRPLPLEKGDPPSNILETFYDKDAPGVAKDRKPTERETIKIGPFATAAPDNTSVFQTSAEALGLRGEPMLSNPVRIAKKELSEAIGLSPEAEPLPMEEENRDSDGNFDWGKLLSVVAPALIGAATGGSFGAIVGAAAGTEYLSSRKERREKKFAEKINLTIQGGDFKGLRAIAKAPGKDFQHLKAALGGLADVLEEKDKTKKIDKIVSLAEAGIYNRAIVDAAMLGDGALIMDISSLQIAAQTTKMNDLARDESALRKEFLSKSKDFMEIRRNWGRIAAVGEGTAAGDLALIFAYMKLLDPRSVVRESEFAQAVKTGSIHDRLWNAYTRALEGKRLNPEVRKKFLKTAHGLYANAKRIHDSLVGNYERIARDYGYDPSRVAIDLEGHIEEIGGKRYTDFSNATNDEVMKHFMAKNKNWEEFKITSNLDESGRWVKWH